MGERKLLNIYEKNDWAPGSQDKGLQVSTSDNAVYLKAFDEWCGSTETGFGAEVGVSLDVGSAIKLRDFLNEWLQGP